MDKNKTVLIRGAGDLASGVAVALWQAGWRVFMTELEHPLCVRCEVSFSRAVYRQTCLVQGIEARRTDLPAQRAGLSRDCISVSTGDYDLLRQELRPLAVVDAVMAKRNLGLQLSDAQAVLALGPGFVAGRDCHAVIESQRGPELGRIIWQGAARADTGRPGAVAGVSTQRVLRAPAQGDFRRLRQIGDQVQAGQEVAAVEGPTGACLIKAQIDGVLRGLLPDHTQVSPGLKCGDVDPRGQRELCFTVSDKAAKIGHSAVLALAQMLEGGR